MHPTPVYEMLAYVAVFGILWSMRKRPHADGTIFCWYLVLVPFARFVIEFWRINPPVAFGLSAAQLFSLVLMAIGACGMLALRGARVGTAVGGGARRAQMKRSIVGPAIAFVVVLGAVVGLQFLQHSPVSGYAALDFTLPDLSGTPVQLSDLRGKIVFLNLWATWCPPCRAEMPSMQTLYERLKGRDFVMLAVAEDTNAADVAGFVEGPRPDLPRPPRHRQHTARALRRHRLSRNLHHRPRGPGHQTRDRPGRVDGPGVPALLRGAARSPNGVTGDRLAAVNR